MRVLKCLSPFHGDGRDALTGRVADKVGVQGFLGTPPGEMHQSATGNISALSSAKSMEIWGGRRPARSRYGFVASRPT